MLIRFLNIEDALSYSVLRQYSLKESPFAFSDSYEVNETKTISDYRKEIQMYGAPVEAFTLGAFSYSGELIGFIKFRRDPRTKARHRASLYSLYVSPDYRGKGIAKELIWKLIKIVESISGIEQLQLSCILTKTSLMEFYQRFGFELLGGIIKDDLIIDNQYVDAVYMVKHLKINQKSTFK